MIGIIDYGMGNLASVQKALISLGYEVVIVTEPVGLNQVDGMIIPGVGAFGDAMANLTDSGFVPVILEKVKFGMPCLGICLGMQLLFEKGWENGCCDGLGLLPGQIVRFNLPEAYKVPHMGWNNIKKAQPGQILKNIADDSYFYFVHSYLVETAEKSIVAGTCNYGLTFPAVVEKGNIFGVQFHPEKSSTLGLKILKNYGELVEQCK